MERKNNYCIVALVAQCLMQAVTTGILLQCIGIFVLPVSEGLGVSTGTFMLYVTAMFVVATLVLTRANNIFVKLGAKKSMLLTGIINGIGIIGFSFSSNIILFILCGGILGVSEALGLFYLTPVILSSWYGPKAGLPIGIAFSFNGIGGIVFNQIGGAVLVSGGWRRAYLVLGIIALAVGVIAGLLTKEREPGAPVEATVAEEVPVEKEELPGIEYSKAIKSAAFVMVAIFALFFEFSTGINPLLASYAAVVGGDASYSVTAATIGTVGATLAGFVIGFINGKSTKAGIYVSALSGLIGMLLFLLCFGSMGMVYAATFLSVFAFTVVTPMLPVVTSAAFGAKDFDRIYAKVTTIAAIPPIIASVAWGYLLAFTSYSVVWICGIIVFAIVLVSALCALKAGKKLA